MKAKVRVPIIFEVEVEIEQSDNTHYMDCEIAANKMTEEEIVKAGRIVSRHRATFRKWETENE